MNDALIERAAKLNVCIALQTSFLSWPQEPAEYISRIIGERISDLSPLKRMHNAGLVMAGGSDAPCSLPDPLAAIHAACNHPNPDESIGILEALRMHTSACAKLSFDENERGTLTTGKLADFVVLDKNPLTMPVEKLDTIKIQGLYLKGNHYAGQNARSIASLLLDAIRNKHRN